MENRQVHVSVFLNTPYHQKQNVSVYDSFFVLIQVISPQDLQRKYSPHFHIFSSHSGPIPDLIEEGKIKIIFEGVDDMKWEVLDSKYHFKTPFGNLRKDTCRMSDGTIINDYYVNEYADWVNAIVLTEQEEIILVEQYRHPGNDFFLEIPAGKIEEGETYEEAIIREVREETGYVSDQKPILLGQFMVNPATQTNKVITFLIVNAAKQYEQELDETERVEVQIFPFEDMESMIQDNRVTQLFSVSAYYIAKHYLNKESSKYSAR